MRPTFYVPWQRKGVGRKGWEERKKWKEKMTVTKYS
jgi:hypothetical protein